MKKKIANYTVIIEKQKRIGTKKECFFAYVPVLGIATDADTLEQVQKEIKSLIEFHLQCLAEEGEPIPVESSYSLITKTEVDLPQGAVLAF